MNESPKAIAETTSSALRLSWLETLWISAEEFCGDYGSQYLERAGRGSLKIDPY